MVEYSSTQLFTPARPNLYYLMLLVLLNTSSLLPTRQCLKWKTGKGSAGMPQSKLPSLPFSPSLLSPLTDPYSPIGDLPSLPSLPLISLSLSPALLLSPLEFS